MNVSIIPRRYYRPLAVLVLAAISGFNQTRPAFGQTAVDPAPAGLRIKTSRYGVAAPHHDASPATPARRSGPCVLLKNDNVLFGRARQLGQFVIVQTGKDAELKLPRSDVACWADALEHLYQYRIDHRIHTGIMAHLEDAQWCLRYELTEQAAAEIAAATALQPNHPALRVLRHQLDRQQQTPRETVTASGSVALATFAPPADPLGHTRGDESDAAEPESSESSAEIDPQRLAGFASQIQPVLINRCGNCHHEHSDRPWQLALPAGGSRPSARISRTNLMAVERFIDPESPLESELFVKATSAHGQSEPPLSSRNAKAIEALKRWLSQWSSTSEPPGSAVNEPTTSPDSVQTPSQSHVAPVSYETEVVAKTAVSQPDRVDRPSRRGGQPRRLPAVANPLDPRLFNRRYHRTEP